MSRVGVFVCVAVGSAIGVWLFGTNSAIAFGITVGAAWGLLCHWLANGRRS